MKARSKKNSMLEAPAVNPLAAAADLEKKISEGARRESESIRAQFREKADRKLAAARSRAGLRRKAILKEARAEAAGVKEKISSARELETRKIILLAREELVEEVFKKARSLFGKLRREKKFPKIMAELAGEAISNLGGKEVELILSGADYRAAGEDFPAAVARLLEEKYSRAAELKLEIRRDSPEVGVIARAGGGRVIFDNTLSARERRRHAELRAFAYERLFSSRGGGDK